jgi:phospholipid-binding lipoprotein MlaA
MIPLLSGRFGAFARPAVAVLTLLGLASCASTPPQASSSIADPLEGLNRGLYQFNVGFDKVVLKPMSESMGVTGREGVFGALSNFSDNIDMPGNVLNDLMQGRLRNAIADTLRFGVNTVFGLGGILDPADDMGIPYKDTDFGETLYVWGADEGFYLVLPFYGPSNERDAFGLLVDDLIDPLRFVLPRRTLWVGTWASLADRFGSRTRHAETVDSLLYESADGYAQARLLAQQYRQFELGQAPSEESFVDPYEDSNGQ